MIDQTPFTTFLASFRSDPAVCPPNPSAVDPEIDADERLHEIVLRYSALMQTVRLPEFTEGEWGVLRDVAGGSVLDLDWAKYLEFSLTDALAGGRLGAKWDVDSQRLLATVRGMCLAQRLVLIEELQAWWCKVLWSD